MTLTESSILIIDDNKEIRESLELFLMRHFTIAESLDSPKNLMYTLTSKSYDIILLDMNFSPGKHSGNEGLFWLREILHFNPDAVVILITAYGKVKLAVKAIKEGAFDFILKPWENEKLLSTIKAGIKYNKSKKEVKELTEQQINYSQQQNNQESFVIGTSLAMRKIHELIKKVAKTDANILITGENGTGKEVIARDIHRKSSRNNKLFMAVDLSALTESLFESELFGYKKGAFTDAKEDRAGKIETANKGTLFLDEIGNLSPNLQSKLLTVLQTKSITRLGDIESKPIDFRLICATNKSLTKLIKNENFREDLFFRINTVQIHIPPLRERKEDILPLSEFFLHQYTKKYNKPEFKLTKSAEAKLEKYSWPGNIRELKHSIERAVILSNEQYLTAENFDLSTSFDKALNKEVLNLNDIEKIAIQKAIEKTGGNMSKASEILGISRTTLYFKISKYGI